MNSIQAVIFDLDGVIVSTDEYHFQAWRQLAVAHGVPFDRDDNERLRGVSRMESLEIILEKSEAAYSDAEKQAMAEAKNTIYRESLAELNPGNILPGVTEMLDALRKRGVKIAIGSSSKNAATILAAIGLANDFDSVVDGTHISRSKPDPEVFTLAALGLGILSSRCLVVEDAEAGVEAGVSAGMRVLGVGPASTHPHVSLGVADLSCISADELLAIQET